MALNVKQKYPGTQGGAAQRFWHSLVTQKKRASIYTLDKIIQRKHDISSTRSSILPCIFFVFLFLPGSVDATWRISSSSLRMCARQDCFVFERPQVVFYCNFSCSRHVSKSANLIGRIVFDAAQSNQKNEPEAFLKKLRFYAWRFDASVCTLTLAPFV